MDKAYLSKIENYQDDLLFVEMQNIFSSFEELKALGKGTRVLLKPNLLTKATPDKNVTTHPQVLKAVILCLQNQGVTDITIADSCGGAAGVKVMGSVYKASGLEQLATETNCKLFTAATGFKKRNENGELVKEFTLLDAIKDTDFIINLPKLKTHVMANMTCGCKNLYGTIPGLLKAELHMRFPTPMLFGKMLIDLNQTIGKTFTIVDGICAMQGDGPASGTTYNANLLLASNSQYFVDIIAAQILDIPASRIDYLQQAIDKNLVAPNYTAENIIKGIELIKPLKDYQKPSSFMGYDFSGGYPRPLRWASPIVVKLCSPKPKVIKSKCIACGKCAEICPAQVITFKNNKATINSNKCIRCFCCHEMCPVKAIDVKRFKAFDFKL